MKYKVGDKVEVIKYGSIIWESKKSKDPRLKLKVYAEDEHFRYLDLSPELVGKVGIITKVSDSNKYAIDGIPGKSAWYNDSQLKLIK